MRMPRRDLTTSSGSPRRIAAPLCSDAALNRRELLLAALAAFGLLRSPRDRLISRGGWILRATDLDPF